MTEPTHCPEHGTSGDVLRGWPCPDACPHFLAYLRWSIDDVKVNGNFTRMWVDEDGQRWKQEFRNHQPAEDAVPETW